METPFTFDQIPWGDDQCPSMALPRPPPLNLKQGKQPDSQPQPMQPPVSPRVRSCRLSSLQAIDELSELLFDDPYPISLPYPAPSVSQAANMVCSLAHFRPGAALTPVGDKGFGSPLPMLPPIKTKARPADVPTPMPNLKIRTPRRHYGSDIPAES